MPGRILFVDDDAAMGETVVAGLERRGYAVTFCQSADEALARLHNDDYDVVVTDLRMKGTNGLELCERIVANRPDIPVIVVTAFGSLETAVAAIRAGAYDFVTKPFEPETLAVALGRATQHGALRAEVRRLREHVAVGATTGELLGQSPPMRAVRDLVARLADSDASVLVSGESGTGKEVVARLLHRTGQRKEGPFVAINCAAIPEALLESELFGHVKGAFTDARESHTGLFAQAHGGTLFLDEIGELPMPLQAKVLRALQERRVRPVGATSETPIDVRLISASNRDLETAIEERRFREDLFFRINVVQIDLPPLRVRGNDTLLLAQHFLARFATGARREIRGFSPAAAEKLLAYGWPGNVRELQNVVERAVALTRFAELTVDDLPEKVRNYQRSRFVLEGEDPTLLVPLEEVERRYILRVLESVGGSRTQAAQVLRVDRKTLYRKLERYRAEVPDGSSEEPPEG